MTPGLLLALLASGAQAPDWFRAFQYAQKPVSLRGCAECQGEPDDLCEVRAGAQSRSLVEYRRERSPAPDRVKLLRARADPDCAVHAAAFFAPKGGVDLAAIRLARIPPSQALIERLGVRFAVTGWPRAPNRRKGVQPATSAPDRAGLRLGLLCWGAERSWPSADLGPANSCEWWLLPVRGEGEADETRASFAVLARPQGWPELFRFGDARWARAFDAASALEESILLGEEAKPAEPAPAPVVASAPPARRDPVRCGSDTTVRAAVLDRFDQWEAQVVGARRSLDRKSFTLDAAAWSGHCQELDVLRSALEQQLGCAMTQEGNCVGAGGSEARR
jgi:hypothetical protein